MRSAALAAGVLSMVKAAEAAPALPEGWLETQRNERGQPCELRAVQPRQGGLLLACGSAGAWEIELSEAGPRFAKSYEQPGEVVGFLMGADGVVWVQLRVLEARPLVSAGSGSARFAEEAPPVPPSASAPLAPTPQPAPSRPPGTTAAKKLAGRVVKTDAGEVVISLGSTDGVVQNDRIELALEHSEELWGTERALSREVLAVGVVTDVSPYSAKVQLGLNERVPLGAVASRSQARLTASTVAPPRVGGVWDLSLMARPFAAFGELGGGMLMSAALGRRFESNWRVRALVDPLAIADVEDGDAIGAADLVILGSYDSHYFEMGLGFGAQTVNDAGFALEPGSGLSVSQLVRLGAGDGLNITVRTSAVLFHSEFDFGGLVATGQIPVARGYWLLFGGGGGNVGYGYGEFGLRVLLSGSGGAGSKFLTLTAGGAALFRSARCDDFFSCATPRTYGGPMAGAGGEWRF